MTGQLPQKSKTGQKVAMIAGIAGIIAFLYRPNLITRLLHRNSDDDIHFHVPTEEKTIALTIDDGPHPDITPQILQLLQRHEVHATFFPLGERIAGNEPIMNKIVNSGHEFGNHLMTDDRSIMLTPAEFSRQLRQAHHLLAPYGDVRWFRPGSGWYNQRMLGQIRKFDYETVVGSVYPYDAQVSYTQFVSRYILDNAKPGAIIILHDGTEERGKTVQVLETVLPALHERGYKVVSLSELVDGNKVSSKQ